MTNTNSNNNIKDLTVSIYGDLTGSWSLPMKVDSMMWGKWK